MKKILLYLSLIVLCLFMAACGETPDNKNNNKEEQEEKKVYVVNVELDQSTIPSEITAYNFDVSTIELKITYSDDSTKNVKLEESYFDASNLAKLNTIGKQTIAFAYENSAYIFTVNVVKGDASLYILNDLNIEISTNDYKYTVTTSSTKKVQMYGECKTNNDLDTATVSVIISAEFTFASDLNLKVKLDGEELTVSDYVINANKITFTIADAFWSPIA